MKRQKECFIGVSAVVHLFLKIAGAMPVVFLLFLVVNVLHGTAWALETLARQVFFDGLQSAVERNSLQAAYSGALWVGAGRGLCAGTEWSWQFYWAAYFQS